MAGSGGVSESCFYMWRALFALVHADNVVADEEVRFMAEAMEDVSFSDEQQAILKQDSLDSQDIDDMFARITDVRDQALFFKYAQKLVHIDGDYSPDEQEVVLRLKKLHMQNSSVDDLIGRVSLELEDDEGGTES